MAELADALASGASGSNTVQVQPLSRAPYHVLRIGVFFIVIFLKPEKLPPDHS